MRVELRWRTEAGEDEAAAKPLAMALWRPGPGWTMMSSGVLGGGLGAREWVLNAQVPGWYGRTDPAAHLAELAAGLGLDGPGVGLLTAAQVTDLVQRGDGGVQAAATVGLRVPTWAAAADGVPDPELAPIWGLDGGSEGGPRQEPIPAPRQAPLPPLTAWRRTSPGRGPGGAPGSPGRCTRPSWLARLPTGKK